MAGDEGDAAGELPVRDRDARVRRRRHAGGHAGHDLELDARLAQHERLLAAAAEDQRIAALQPHHPPPGAPVLDQQPVDLLLRHLRPAALLADVDQFRVRPRVLERLLRDQAVVEDDVGRGDQLDRADRQQPRVAGPGADQVHGRSDRARLAARVARVVRAHAIASACANRPPAPAASMRRASSSPSAPGSSSATHAEPSGSPTKPRIVPSRAWIPTGV